eukprot:TRINITY_DN1769_c0_g1_i5.p1 TRINITY_DN1769_c0_g1~~TRINITY_DN1769_c0_g1_i5.p1  ORF type:complete len:100 (-),score=15.30 TRINITY_DN1769_c0_g1_i5:38-337(-)
MISDIAPLARRALLHHIGEAGVKGDDEEDDASEVKKGCSKEAEEEASLISMALGHDWLHHHAEHGEHGDPVVHRGSHGCLLYTSPSPRDRTRSRMPSSA